MVGTPVSTTLNFLLGLNAAGEQRNPVVSLSWSDDGGHTYPIEVVMNAGKVGQYKYRCIARRLGRSRDRVYQVQYADTAPFRIVDAYLKGSGFQPTPRLADKMRQQA